MAKPKFHATQSKFPVSCYFCAGAIPPGDEFVARGSLAICGPCASQITTIYYQINNG